MPFDDLLVFGGSGSPRLTKRICDHLAVEQGKGEVLRFPEGNLCVRILENVRGRHVYLVQSVAFPANDNFVELLFWADAFRRASAASVTAVVPYFSYAKGDKKDEPRVSIRARVCADALEAAGADRFVTMDLHAPQIQGFFRIPVDVHDIIGNVRGRTAVIVDDFTIAASTLVKVAERLLEQGARAVVAAVTHGLFCGRAVERIDASPIRRLLVTDTVETQPAVLSEKIEVVSVASLFGEAIRRIHDHESISVLFDA